MDRIELIHIGGERMTVQVTSFGPGEYVFFRWPICAGTYKFSLRKNAVIFLRRTYTWRAVDIHSVWEKWNDAMGFRGIFRRGENRAYLTDSRQLNARNQRS